MKIDELLHMAVDRGASDLHIRVPSQPVLRIQGQLIVQEDLLPVTDEDAARFLSEIISPEQADIFNRTKELDFSYTANDLARFRVNIMRQRGSLSIAFRLIPLNAPSIDELGLPKILKELVLKPRGLILVTGQTGNGKSTTLAAMINHLNDHDKRNIVIIEEPIEFIHPNRQCLIAQREVGTDTDSFATALVHALRHDPDVIVLGEMRDLTTISTAITAAETGHLVLGTLHTYNAPQTVDRLIDIFPSDQQNQVRLQISQTIEAVISQTLVPKINGGRTAAFEIMIANPAIRNLIRDGKAYQMISTMHLGTREGMTTMDYSLANLVREGLITKETALSKIFDKETFEKWLNHIPVQPKPRIPLKRQPIITAANSN